MTVAVALVFATTLLRMLGRCLYEVIVSKDNI